ncbi:LuxR C-terminal-related transcriptional regulator [uncultured Thalassolituus sp.]|uniref:LuxR C-terminal-related transcriptional regulator n=3 Tax=uncultured Thalassolituus sp. TaxID=285273 RepID=UPI002622DBFC|nr:LuxR C-terminal-related transcriptional regulator [uncultured Thalassolituus sp.]
MEASSQPRTLSADIPPHTLSHKLTVPVISSGYIDRSDRLLEKLSDSATVVITAPAGYGKTALMAASARFMAESRQVAWYQCDRFDGDAHMMIQGISAALTSFSPDAATANDEQQLLMMLDTIGNNGHACTLFIDDIEGLQSADSHDILRLLIRYRPVNMQLVLGGRTLPFPAGHLLLDPGVSWCRANDLAFQATELSEWLNRQQVMLRADQQASLLRRTEGWAAGLALWLLAWRCAGMPEHWSDELGMAEMSDYLAGEVINRLTSEQQLLLRSVALLGTFNETLAGHVVGGGVHDDLRVLLRSELYLTEVPGRPEWYRMSPMISQCLSRTFPQSQRAQIHSAAYDWFRDRDEPMAALYHACQGDISDESVGWLEGQSESILAGLDIRGLLDWFIQLNDDQLFASTDLLRVACWTHLLSYRLTSAEALIERFAALPQIQDGDINALQGYLAGMSGQLSRAERLCRMALEQLPAERFSTRFLCASMLSGVALAHRDADGARLWNRFSLDIARKTREKALEAMAHLDHGRIEFNRGHVNRCLDVLSQGLSVARSSAESEASMAHGRLLVLQGAVSWITGSGADTFDELMSQALYTCEQRSDPAAAYGYAIRALNFMGQGSHGLALSVLDEGERHLQEQQVEITGYAWLHTVRANIWISQAKYRRAHECLEALLTDADSAGVARCEYGSLLPGFALLTRARLLLMSGQLEECLQLTEHWLRHTPQGFMSTFIRLIRSGALVMTQQHAESMRQIEIVRKTFRAEGLNQQLHNWLPDLASFLNVPEITQSPATGPMAALSDREKDVLQLMAQGHSNQDIADKLYISLHTVKTHARKVNVKLGTRSRTQAIHKAKELMII